MQKNYALRITNYELFIKKLRITHYELRIIYYLCSRYYEMIA